MNRILESGIVALVMCLVLGGGYLLFVDDEPEVGAPLECEVCEDGADGARGYNGAKGDAGPAGPVGPQGPAGTSTSIDLDDLADEVADIIEENEDEEYLSERCSDGTNVFDFDVPDDGTYEFTFKNFGSGDFYVYVEDEEGDEIADPLFNSSGRKTLVSTLSLNDHEVYKITIEAENSCKITVTDR